MPDLCLLADNDDGFTPIFPRIFRFKRFQRRNIVTLRTTDSVPRTRFSVVHKDVGHNYTTVVNGKEREPVVIQQSVVVLGQ